MFKVLADINDDNTDVVTFTIDGETVTASSGLTLAGVILTHGMLPLRRTPISGAPRAPYCMMGSCFECLVEIDGVPNQQACMTRICEGMDVRRQFDEPD